jgi:hypothetical protein
MRVPAVRLKITSWYASDPSVSVKVTLIGTLMRVSSLPTAFPFTCGVSTAGVMVIYIRQGVLDLYQGMAYSYKVGHECCIERGTYVDHLCCYNRLRF